MAIYRDFALDFLPDPNTGDLRFVEDDAAVAQSVKILVLTALYERPFQPSVGSIVSRLLFEPLDAVTEVILSESIRDVITNFEPRVTLKEIAIYRNVDEKGRELDPNEIVVTISFLVMNRPNLVTTSIALRRLR